MRSNRKLRLAVSYAVAAATPVAAGFGWTAFDPLLQGVPGYVALLLLALIARFVGFYPAIVATWSFAVVLWFHVLPTVFPERPLSFLAIRLLLFVIAAAAVASLSRQTAVEVREAEKRCRILVETSPDGIVVCDETGEILLANVALAQLVGAGDAQNLVGKKLIELAHGDSRALLQQALAGAAPATEMQWLTLEGRALDVEIAQVWVRKGGENRLHMFVRDVTARKNAEAKLDETARRMTALFDVAIDAILWADSSGRYIDANPAACSLLGYTREEILSKQVGDFTPPGRQEAISMFWHDIRTRGGRRGEFTILRKDGQTREVEFVAAANVLPGFHCVFMHDITGRKDAEQSVQRLSARLLHLQDEERRRIARQLHDTTAQDLTALKLNLARMQRSLAAPPPAVQESLEESIALTDQAINEIRTLAYLLHPPMIEQAGLAASLRWYAKGFETRTGIRVTLDFPEELGLPLDLETAMFRIVQEALSNIQRHSGSAVASIRLERRPDALALQIGDQGRGIPLPLREDERLLAASGVGIAGMRERIREFGGRVNIESRDTGTVVNVTLPLPEN
jgi:PAS domain S-box-containing protein